MSGRQYQTNPSAANPDVRIEGVQYERNPGAETGDHIMNTTAICNTSASHTYGNVLAVVEKYLLDLFPADTFKTIMATTTLAPRQLTHLPKQLHKKEMPTMVLAPRISFGQEDNRFLAHTQMNSRFTNTFANWGEGSLLELARDRRRQIAIHGHYNRAVMYIDVVISFNTFMEQTNWMSYLHNMIPIMHNFFIKAPLELYLPEEFCKLIGELGGQSIHDVNEKSVNKFLRYMNSMWYHPITYKLRGSSNNDSFFMYYLADIDTVVQEPQPGPGIKDGQIKRNFDIAFTIRCDFNTVGYFTVNCPGIKDPIRINDKHTDAIIPLFTDIIDMNNFRLPVGWSILGFPIFKLDRQKEDRSVSLDPILNTSIRKTLEHHLKYGIPIERFLKIEFRENGNILPNEAFYVDWIARELVVINPDYTRTYRLLITVSHEYCNSLVKEVYGLE
jgi:hypothetical protein